MTTSHLYVAPKVATFSQLVFLEKKFRHATVAKFKQFLIENLIRTTVGDRELAKNKELVKDWAFGKCHKIYNMRELSKREMVITP